MPPTTNERATAGPAFLAAAAPVYAKNPAPMMAPMPRVVRFNADKDRLSPCSSLYAASALRESIDFLPHRFAINTSLWDDSKKTTTHPRAGSDGGASGMGRDSERAEPDVRRGGVRRGA